MNKYNQGFDKIIKGLEKSGGSYNGVQVKRIHPGAADADVKIVFKSHQRVKH